MPEVPPTKNLEGRLSRASILYSLDSRLRGNDDKKANSPIYKQTLNKENDE